MKKSLCVILAVVLIFGIFSTEVFAKEDSEKDAVVYINERKTSDVSAKFISGDLYISVADIFEYYGYSAHEPFDSATYIIFDGTVLLRFDWKMVDGVRSELHSYTYFSEEGISHFKFNKDILDEDDNISHAKPMKKYDKSKKFA